MASYNRVILLGNLTRDPDLKYTPSGLAVCEVGLAVNDRRRTPEGEWVEEATFIDVTLWGKTAETCSQYLQKGAPILVEGRLKLDTWEQEGQKRSKLRVVGERMQMVGGRGASSGGGSSRTASRDDSEAYGGYDGGGYSAPSRSTPPPADDIPF